MFEIMSRQTLYEYGNVNNFSLYKNLTLLKKYLISSLTQIKM